MSPVGQQGGRANPYSSSNPLNPLESYNFAYLLTMENYNDSDDTSFEDLNRVCRHARKFIDGSLPFFFNEEAEEEEEQQNHEDPSPRTREVKWIHQRLVWSSHLRVLQHEKLFKRTYRMSRAAHPVS
jgi:hypothetical protein